MQSFRDAELQGWDRKAGHWDDTLGAVTPRAIEPLLDAVGAAPGVHLLDMACGTGALAAEAAWRGAEAVGTDFAPTMIAEAVQRHPGLEFRVGDAELHMERPGRVLAEIARVLRPAAGRFAMTAWTSVGEFFALVGQAVQAHADTGVPLPPAPPIFRLRRNECRSALLEAGFAEPAFQQLPLVWTGEKPEVLLDILCRGTVRTPMLIEAQTPEVRATIEQAILRGAKRYRRDEKSIVLRWPALLTAARRA